MCKVLVIDSDLDILKVVEILLTMHDCNVETLSAGAEVHECISRFKPNIILLDIHLGLHDGRQICKEIKNRMESKHLPVILFSAQHEMGESALENQADHFFEKPFDVKHLISTVKRYCN